MKMYPGGMKTRRASCLIAALLTSATSALAQSDDTDLATGSVYARFGAGGMFPRQLDQDLTFDPTISFVSPPPTGRETGLSAAPSVSFALGFAYPAGTRTELEYRYVSSGIDMAVETGGAVDTALAPSGDFNIHFLMSNAYYTLLGDEKFSLFVGAGVGGAFTNNGFGQSDAAFAYQGRAGVSTRVGDGYDLSFEYLYVRTRDLIYGPESFVDSEETFRLDGAQFISSGVTASLRKTF